ncbi:MAG: hypothetical protein OEM07_01135 [Gammaproteobacteria bacterium]|nr:hypothetical protein [Gammaproteobacteria bacterium]
MSTNEIWYGVLEAGEKTSPVVRDNSIETSQNKIYLYNHVRDKFIEYAQEIVEPKLRELKSGDIAQDQLDRAFIAARKVFFSLRKVNTWSEPELKRPAPRPKDNEPDSDITNLDLSDDENEDEEFIDDD